MNSEPKMLKVIYFDEESAIDYLDLYHGGLQKVVKESKRIFGSGVSAGAKVEAKTGILFNIISSILDLRGSANLRGEISRIGESALKTTITNTVLGDYLKTAVTDHHVEKLSNYSVVAYLKSMSFYKMYTPYLKMVKAEDENIDFSKIDETLEKSKGYFELLAVSNKEVHSVLRFNIKAFRNNYSLVDLTKMNLTYYSINVGSMVISKLDAEKEFNNISNEEHISVETVVNQDKVEENEKPVYDVVLAGITSND